MVNKFIIPGVKPKPWLSFRSAYILPTLLILLAITARILPGARSIDDSFITFRYARNILAGNGFTYNPGEHVLGTTTPLYTILLAGLASLSGGTQAPFPQIALLVNAMADALTCVLLLSLGRRFKAPLAGVAAGLVWAIAPFSVSFAIGGLETSVYVLLLVGLFSAYLANRPVLAAFLAALALLTRPDALILLGPLLVDRGWRLIAPSLSRAVIAKSATPWKELLAFATPVLPWIIFASFYFGSPLPHSIAAKSLAYHLPPDAAFVRLLQHYATPFMDNLTFGVTAIGVGLVLYPAMSLIGGLHAFKLNRHAWPFLAYPWLYFATFAIANPLIFRWYLTPPLPFYIFFILVGLEQFLRSVFKEKSTPVNLKHPKWLLMAGVVILIPFILMLRDWQIKPDHGLQRPAPEMAWYKLELLYRQAAESLAADIAAHSEASPTHPPVLAAGDVGVLGFFSGATILDTVGLNSPVSTRYYPLPDNLYITNYAIPPDLILDQLPDYLVIMEVYGRAGLLQDARFQAQYRLREVIATDTYTSQGMLIFEKMVK